MTIANYQQELSTQEGFANKVSAKSPWFGAGIASILVGLGLFAFNIFQLGSATGIDWDWGLIGQLLFRADALEFSGRRAGRSEIFRYVAVWGPVILIPLGIILLIVHFVTRSQAAGSLYNDYASRGFVGRQFATSLSVVEGRAQTPVAFIAGQNVSDEQFGQVLQQFDSYVQSLDKKGVKQLQVAATKAGVLTGTSAANVLQGLPGEIVASKQVGKGTFVAVIPPAAAGGKFKILPIKD